MEVFIMIYSYQKRLPVDDLFFTKSMLNFLETRKNKYQILVYCYIWNTCYYFKYCNDPIKTISSYLGIGTDKTSLALRELIENGFISDKPYMIKETNSIFKNGNIE